MKKFSLKFILFIVLSIFSSFAYAEGVFSRYYNTSFDFSIDIPLEKYEQDTYEGTKTTELEFIKKSTVIPSKNYFKGSGSLAGDGISIKSQNEDVNILIYGTYLLRGLNAENLDEERIKESFKNNNLNFNEFVKKYYNGKLPEDLDELKFDYSQTLFTLGNSVTYSTLGKDFYVISYKKDNKIYYTKVVYNDTSSSYVVFETFYSPKDKKFMDKIVAEMANSIKF